MYKLIEHKKTFIRIIANKSFFSYYLLFNNFLYLITIYLLFNN